MKVSRGLLVVTFVTMAVPLCAQSLGELAKKEAERRKTTPPAGKVYTNDDLKKISVPGDTVADDKDAKDSKDGKDSKDPKDGKDPKDPKDAKDPKDSKDAKAAEPAKDEAGWHAKMSAARD